MAICSVSTVFEEPEDPSNRSFFSEIISSVSDVKFSHSGRYMLTRDYLTVKVWDLNMEARPIETYQVGAAAQTDRSPSQPPSPVPTIPPRGDIPGCRGGVHIPVLEAKTVRLRKSGSPSPAPSSAKSRSVRSVLPRGVSGCCPLAGLCDPEPRGTRVSINLGTV